jgi:hypothetical protein
VVAVNGVIDGNVVFDWVSVDVAGGSGLDGADIVVEVEASGFEASGFLPSSPAD